jgi:ABC-type uncharacterized transport system permease subunit
MHVLFIYEIFQHIHVYSFLGFYYYYYYFNFPFYFYFVEDACGGVKKGMEK